MRIAFLMILFLVVPSLPCFAADKAPWIQRPIAKDGILGLLFVHDGPPRPTFLVLGGSEGGVEGSGKIARDLADLGYNALTMAYFGMPKLRPQLVRVPLEDFFHAIDWLHQQPFAGTQRIGIVGGSKGAEAALLVACERNDLGVVVAYAPTHVVWECIDQAHGTSASSWTRAGADLPFVPYKRVSPTDVNSNWGWDCLRDLHVASLAVTSPEALEQATIPVEKIRAPLLLFSGGQDLVWPSLTYANAIEERLKKMKSGIAFKNMKYPEAGHSFSVGSSENGGTDAANRAAEKDSLVVLKAFLARHLPIDLQAAPKE